MEDCYYFYTAVCRRADACRFRHVVRSQDNAQLCKYYRAGTCTNPQCKFKHNNFDTVHGNTIISSSSSNGGSRATDTFVDSQTAEKQELCIYHFHGRCRLGKNCKFVHADAELSVVPQSFTDPSIVQALSCSTSSSSSSSDNLVEVSGKHELEDTQKGSPSKVLKIEKAKSILSRYSNSMLAAKAKRAQELQREKESLEIEHATGDG